MGTEVASSVNPLIISCLQQIREQNIPIVHQIRHQIQRPYIPKLHQIRHFHSSSPILTLPNSSGIGRRTVTIATSQCGGDGENDVVPEHNIEDLPSAFTGHIT
ncbi:hypothetical protein CMV_019236 [Castanea mollissima]|uniref:Uncharacterized protein n=1 Tax=Castanea mollissima TaxID=60419 RepID=A0A8J4R0S4_9ROSI|nr:hypothetical protein CMV_019236 [Castanea mollissima]